MATNSTSAKDRLTALENHVAATPEFTKPPHVADGASELLRDVFGAESVSSRLVVGVASLPLGSPIEIEVILEVES